MALGSWVVRGERKQEPVGGSEGAQGREGETCCCEKGQR